MRGVKKEVTDEYETQKAIDSINSPSVDDSMGDAAKKVVLPASIDNQSKKAEEEKQE